MRSFIRWSISTTVFRRPSIEINWVINRAMTTAVGGVVSLPFSHFHPEAYTGNITTPRASRCRINSLGSVCVLCSRYVEACKALGMGRIWTRTAAYGRRQEFGSRWKQISRCWFAIQAAGSWPLSVDTRVHFYRFFSNLILYLIGCQPVGWRGFVFR